MPRKTRFTLPDDLRAYLSEASARRQRVDSVCQLCGATMPNVLPTRRYCSAACHDRAAYERRLASTGKAPQRQPRSAPGRKVGEGDASGQ